MSEGTATMSNPQLAEIAALKAQIAKLEADKAAMAVGNIRLKVGEKGGIVFSGLGAHPWAPYLTQLRAVVNSLPDVFRFIAAHYGELQQKEGKEVTLAEIKNCFVNTGKTLANMR